MASNANANAQALPPVIVLFGPTASGKTGLGIQLAQAFNGVVINADSRQVYRHMPIITAMPTPEEQAQAPHRLYAFLEPEQSYSAKEYMQQAAEAVQAVWAEGKLPILVGGTGFYLKALHEGLSAVPDISPEMVAQLNARLAGEGHAALYQQLLEKDPASAALIRSGDAQKIVRALSVVLETGQSLSAYQALPRQGALAARFFFIALNPERERLNARIHARFEGMEKEGLRAEMEALQKAGYGAHLPSLKSIGIPEFFNALAGHLTWQEACEGTLQNMRRYAKRQRTWLRHQYPADLVIENPEKEKAAVMAQVQAFL